MASMKYFFAEISDKSEETESPASIFIIVVVVVPLLLLLQYSELRLLHFQDLSSGSCKSQWKKKKKNSYSLRIYRA